jgi:murein DD-endopeptidase MepM/ murein hydrolase activator NlpD
VPRSRHVRLGVIALPIAVLATLASTIPNRPIRPVGEVRDAVAAQPDPVSSASVSSFIDPRLTYLRATDRDAPRAGQELFPPRPAALTGYVWPLAHGRITLPFKAIPGGTRIKDGKLWHDGLDVATFCGDSVLATHDGVVLAAGRRFDDFIGWVGDLGPYYKLLDARKLWDDLPIVVVIDDENGYRSMYAHFSKVTVAAGDRVRAGQRIGFEGRTGHASGCHVHYGLFSPLEPKTFGVRADILKRLKLPVAEIARIDPIEVLPDGPSALGLRRFPVPPASPAPPPRAAASPGE